MQKQSKTIQRKEQVNRSEAEQSKGNAKQSTANKCKSKQAPQSKATKNSAKPPNQINVNQSKTNTT